MYEYCTFINVHMSSQLLLEQFHILFESHSGTSGHKVQTTGARIAHCTPNHLARWVLRYRLCVFFSKSFP